MIWECILHDFSFIFVSWFYNPECDISWCVIQAILRIIHILLLLDQLFYKCQLDHIDWWCYPSQLYSYLFFVCLSYQLQTEKCWSMNYNSGFIPSWSSVHFSLMFSDALLFDAYSLYCVLFGELTPFSLCNVTFHFWKSSLPEMNRSIPKCGLISVSMAIFSISQKESMWRHSKKVATYKLGRDLGRIQLCWYLDLRLVVSRTVER